MNHNDNGTIAIGAPNSVMRSITEPAEPIAEPTPDYTVRTSTPWGTAQSAYHYGRGLIAYSTASHGGFHVSNGLLKRIPDYMQTADRYADGKQGWFEEDVAWAIVVVCLPEFFPVKIRYEAIRTMRQYYLAAWEQFCRA